MPIRLSKLLFFEKSYIDIGILVGGVEVMWRLEVSEDNQTWTTADERSTLQPVTYYRRRIASFGSPEDGQSNIYQLWYFLISENKTLFFLQNTSSVKRKRLP